MKYINPHGAPRSWCNAVKDAYDIDSNIEMISVSGLHLPPKIRILTARHQDEIEVDVIDRAHTLFGEAFHYVVGKAQDDTYISEKRILTVIRDKIFTGKPDLYDKINYVIEDYKTASVWTYTFNKREWESKMNCYAWLEETVNHRKVERLLAVVYFKDWRNIELLRYPDYPEHNLYWFNPPLWSIPKQRSFIDSRIQIHKDAEKYSDDEISTCTQKERYRDNDIYAVHKVVKGKLSKRAVNAQCTTKELATEVLESLYLKHGQKDEYAIDYRPGLDKRCTKYCSVNKFCNYYKETYNE